MVTASVSTLPTRKLLPLDVEPERDEHGFLNAFQEAEGLEACFDLELVLIVAPPWTGKSFVSKQLQQHLERHADRFGKYVHRTDFEQDSGNDVLPSWWDAWQHTDANACWIIDAVDEDGRTDARGVHRILNALDGLQAPRRRALCVFMFARENEVPKKIVERLMESYGDPEATEERRYRVLRLAPLDSANARDLVGGDEAFNRVRNLIAINKLQDIAGYPAVLETLVGYSADAIVSDIQVWKDVLINIIRGRRTDPTLPTRRSPLELQFQAAARLAVILTFGDAKTIRETDGYPDGPSIDALIPLDHPPSQALNAAGQEVLRSGIFRRTIRGFQFAQHHVQQWLAAFGAAHLSLVQLRPLLSDGSRKALELHRGVMSLLLRTSKYQAVRDWIINQHGGVPPRSDAAPWDLSLSVAALDRLQGIVKTTEWGLSLWSERGLGFLATHGLGKELATRLADNTLNRNERELMMDVAVATHNSEVVPAAMAIALDATADPRLRDHATTSVIVLGKKEDWLRLASELPMGDGKNGTLASMRGRVIQELFEKGIWDFATAVREAPEYSSRSSLLHYRLENAMTVDHARSLLANIDAGALSNELKTRRPPYRGTRLARLVIHAIELITGQDPLSPADFEALRPIALAQFRKEWRSADVIRLTSIIAKDRDARRALFRDVVAQSPVGAEDVTGYVWPLFDTEDLGWLLGVAEEDNGRHPWIWRHLLEVVSWRTVPDDARERVRRRGKEVVPGVIERVDRDKAAAEEREKEYERQREAIEKEQRVSTFNLAELVDDTLANGAIPLCEKMRRLSWFCLCDDETQPTNVTGKWEDLGDDRQARILDLCEKALRDCDPTPIPTGNSYPMTIVYEASCFARVTELRTGTYALDEQQVGKWLQSTLVTSMTRNEDFVLQCYSAAPAATEAVLIRELKRSLSSEPQMLHWVESLPPDVWSQSLSQSVAAEAAAEQYALQGRRELLRILLVRSRPHALPAATAWLKSTDADARVAAVNLLILTEPELVWEEFRRQITAGGRDAFLRLPNLSGRHHTVPTALTSWPAPRIEELYNLLRVAFPPESDPKREEGVAYDYGTEDQYRDLRNGLSSLLLSRGTVDDIAALERLSSKYDSIRNWYATMRARAEAGEVLSELQRKVGPRPAGATPCAKVARLLDVAVYRLVRTPGDLQDVLVEEIENIATDAKEHLSCLYYPRKGRKAAGTGKQKSLQEDALQAYFYYRLRDRLAGRVLEAGTKVILNREPLTTKDQRNDIKVEALALSNVFVTVVIELKWSDHKHVSTSLRTQLGDEYLVNGALTHGIYLVGWNAPGTWRDKAATAPANRSSPTDWHTALAAQAGAYAQTHPGILIAPVVVDLAWPQSSSVKTNRRDRTTTTRATARGTPRSAGSKTKIQVRKNKATPRKSYKKAATATSKKKKRPRTR